MDCSSADKSCGCVMPVGAGITPAETGSEPELPSDGEITALFAALAGSRKLRVGSERMPGLLVAPIFGRIPVGDGMGMPGGIGVPAGKAGGGDGVGGSFAPSFSNVRVMT